MTKQMEELQQVVVEVQDMDRLHTLVAERRGRIELQEVEHLGRQDLHRVARALLNWNCNQPVKDSVHNAHYKRYIQPIHDLLDRRWEARMVRHEEKRRTMTDDNG